MGEWDPDEVRRLFTSLEFRSLLDRLEEVGVTKPKVEVTELDLREVSAGRARGDDRVGRRRRRAARRRPARGARRRRIRRRERRPRSLRWPRWGRWQTPWLAERAEVGPRREGAGTQCVRCRASRSRGWRSTPSWPATCSIPPPPSIRCARSARSTWGQTSWAGRRGKTEGQLFSDAGWRPVAAEAAAVALLAPVMEEQIDKQGLRDLLETVEMPLASVLAPHGGARRARSTSPTSTEMGDDVRDRMADAAGTRSIEEAGEEFNLNSPPQLRVILYEKLGLSPGKRTPKGQLSTDASVLEKLRDHPSSTRCSIGASSTSSTRRTSRRCRGWSTRATAGSTRRSTRRWRRPAGCRRRTRTCRTSRSGRSSAGRSAGRSSRAAPGQVLLVADYSQIELRILAHLSGDEGLREAFASGHDIHTATSATRVRHPRGQGRSGPALAGEDDQLRTRLRDERVGARVPPRHRARRGAGDHGRVLRRASRASASSSTVRWTVRPSTATPRRSSGDGDTSRSSRRPTRAYGTWVDA